MEKNKAGKNPSPDRDDMNIKKQLDTAFETDNLTVSEDLIQRTLLKIKETKATDTGNDINSSMRRKFPVKRFVGAAAAILLLITALWIYQNSITGAKMDGRSLNHAKVKYGLNSNKSTQEFAGAADASQASKEATEDSGSDTSKEAAKDSDSVTNEFTVTEKDDALNYGLVGGAADDKTELKVTASSLRLSELYAVNIDEIQSFTSQGRNGKKKKLSVDHALKLYDLLRKYTVETAEAKASGNYLYHVVITVSEGKTITYEFYEDSTVNVTDERTEKSTETGTQTYVIDNGTDLLGELENIIKK